MESRVKLTLYIFWLKQVGNLETTEEFAHMPMQGKDQKHSPLHLEEEKSEMRLPLIAEAVMSS